MKKPICVLFSCVMILAFYVFYLPAIGSSSSHRPPAAKEPASSKQLQKELQYSIANPAGVNKEETISKMMSKIKVSSMSVEHKYNEDEEQIYNADYSRPITHSPPVPKNLKP